MKTLFSCLFHSPHFLLTIITALCFIPLAHAQDFICTTNAGGVSVTITGYTGPGGNVTIPDTITGLPVTTIGNDAFLYCYSLSNVAIPDSVTTIGNNAFTHCSRLTSVTIPDSVTSIGVYAFASCTSLTNVTIGNGVTSIADHAFDFCYSLTNVIIGGSVTSIGNDAFLYCSSLTNVAIPDSVTTIGNNAFTHCSRLTSVTIPDSVTSIGDEAFFDCSSLTSVIIGNSVTSIGNYAFYYCSSLTNVAIPDSVTTIGNYVFFSCASLAGVTIGNGLVTIGFAAFASCPSLAAITVSANNPVYSSVDGMLFNKTQTAFIQYPGGRIGSYTIPDSITNIGVFAFAYCTSLTSVTIPGCVASIEPFAFGSCASLAAITVATNNPAYSSADGVLFNKSQTLLIQYPGGRTGSYTIPNSVTNIGDFAFARCTSLTSVTIPNSVASIENGAFADCASLTSVFCQGNAPSLGEYWVFSGATNTTVYYLPGATNWGAQFGDRPTALWNPSVDAAAPNFGPQPDGFTLPITGTTNIPIVLEAATNLASSSWIPLHSCTLTNGSIYFTDPAWTNHPTRFYRIRSP